MNKATGTTPSLRPAALKLSALLLVAGAGAAGAAGAAPKITAQSIIVNPVQSSLTVQVRVNRDASGQGSPVYAIGDRINVTVKTSQDAYVYLFDVNADGSIDLFAPNRYEDSNFVKAGQARRFPMRDDAFRLTIGGPVGQDKLLALASTTRLNIDQIARFKQDQQQGFADVQVQGQQQLAQALSIVVSPLPQDSWVTDVAYFTVADANGYTGNAGSATVQPAPVQPAPVVVQPQPTEPVTSSPVTSQPTTSIQPGQRQDGSFDQAIVEAYSRTKGPDSLGQATTYVSGFGDGVQQKFAGVAAYGNGVILHANGSSRAFAVHGRILERYLALAQAENGGTRPPSRLGWAAGDEKIITRNTFGTTGLYGFFQNGAIYSSTLGTFWLTGGVLKYYQGLGGSGSFLGFPVRDAYIQGGQWAGEFQGGYVRYVGGRYVVTRK